ncbi:MAG: TIGR04076 family protein [Candidatus Bathyarchaeia archaeon]
MRSAENYRLVITVKEIRGKCPVFKVGDRIVIEQPKILLKKTDNLCVHALGSMLSMIIPLSKGIGFKDLGLAKEEGDKGYVQCLDPGEPYTEGGTVIFEIRREKVHNR